MSAELSGERSTGVHFFHSIFASRKKGDSSTRLVKVSKVPGQGMLPEHMLSICERKKHREQGGPRFCSSILKRPLTAAPKQ